MLIVNFGQGHIEVKGEKKIKCDIQEDISSVEKTGLSVTELPFYSTGSHARPLCVAPCCAQTLP